MAVAMRVGCSFCIVLIQLIVSLSIFGGHALCATGSTRRNNLIVEFSPYVSVLDQWDFNRYNISEQIPLIEKVATEYSRVIIDLKHTFYGDSPFSLLESPLAIATYNKRLKSSERKLEVWITSTEPYKVMNPVVVSRHLKFIADKANDIYERTVTTLLVAYHTEWFPLDTYKENITKEIQNKKEYNSMVSKRSYKLGVINMDHRIYLEAPSQPCNISKLNVDIVVFYMKSHNIEFGPSLYCDQHQSNERDTKVAFWFRTSDTDNYGAVNMSRHVKNWKNGQKFVDDSQTTIIMSKAFDTTCESPDACAQGVSERTQGWWRLVENPEYSSTAQYIFEAKKDIAERFDREANSINRTLIEKSETNLTRSHLGIIFGLALSETYGQWEYGSIWKSLEKITDVIMSHYSKMVILLDQNDTEANAYYKTNDVTRRFLGDMEMIVLLLPGVNLQANQDFVSKFLGQKIGYGFLKTPTFVFSVDARNYAGHSSNELEIKNSLYRNPNIGYAFSISDCSYASLTEQKEIHFVETWNKSSLVLFTFEEDKETVKLGAERMFQQRIATFGQCERFLRKMKSLHSANGTVQHGFVMLHYESPPYLYDDVIALYNFVLYWEKLKDWAVLAKTMIIMSSAFDCTRNLEGRRNVVQERGWWRYHYTEMNKESSNIYSFINKKTELLNHKDFSARIATTPVVNAPELTEDARVTAKDIIFIAVSIVLVVCTGVIVFGLSRRCITREFLSTSEVNEFLNGNQNSDNTASVYKLPYDKSRFEIDSKSFSIDHNKVLGSGEFGVVCPGKVATSVGIFVDVAVKMVNSNKFHKTTLTGLLSEVKVLAHVGKHENVIELVGAYTRELRKGKVFVILELGQCGSLEKYLRNQRPLPTTKNDDMQTEDGIELTEMHDSSDAGDGSDSVLLDESISKDMYRWSKEICSGMSFLASKHVVHADLATRNVLLNAEKTAKICDFGLSRRMYNYANYVKQRQEPLPWKWLPPESLQLMEFNEKSDVWAYGVTLWEIYSLGETPYPGLSWDVNFSRMLEQGFRMGSPKYNERNMYSLMMKCWNTNPFGRPSFADLLLLFDEDKIIE